jgi:outer membrane lipoprotein-sorting protein
MPFLIALLVLCFVTAIPTKAKADDPVLEIVKKMKAAFESARPSTRTVTMTMDAKGETVQWVARQAYKQFPEGKKMVMVLLEPADAKGNAYAIWEPTEKPSTVWMYMPAIRRVRELAPMDVYEHFLGTDFTYADLGFVRLHPQYRLIGEEAHAGKQTYQIEESVPKERAYYSRIITWVDKDSMLPLQRDYYDSGGHLWKTELFTIETIDGTPTPIRIQMTDLEGKSSTTLQISAVRYDTTIPDDVFDPLKLPGLATSPVWQATGAQAAPPQ